MLLDKSVIDIIEDIAAENPDRTAVESSEGTLTYGQLWQQSEEIAGRLSASLGDNRKPVMVYGHKNPQMIVSFLACVKSGRAYCPVDISMPRNRIEDIAKTIGNDVILAAEPFELEGFNVIDVKNAREKLTETEDLSPEKRVSGDDTFYIIFTSGSTGNL